MRRLHCLRLRWLLHILSASLPSCSAAACMQNGVPMTTLQLISGVQAIDLAQGEPRLRPHCSPVQPALHGIAHCSCLRSGAWQPVSAVARDKQLLQAGLLPGLR